MDFVAGVETDSDAGNLPAKCSLCVHESLAGRDEHRDTEQTQCPKSQSVASFSKMLVSQNLGLTLAARPPWVSRLLWY
jgi:hypothetical protein